MRRAVTVLGTAPPLLAVSTAASIWTAFTQARGRHLAWLFALIALVQVPAAVPAFVPIADPLLHAVALVATLGVTASPILYTRREARTPAPAVTR